MNDNAVESAILDYASTDWQQLLAELAFAHGTPEVRGLIKAQPQDFRVVELLDIEPSGEGEHYWVSASKIRRSTDQVAKSLARFAGVPLRDVGYSGLKDFQAETTQWFSVRVPLKSELRWQDFHMEGVRLERTDRHHRKIKRGTHRANYFELVVRELGGEIDELPRRIERVRQQGAPNYFGPQRFGRDAGNMPQAIAMLLQGKVVKNRSLRGLLLSSARSWLFNHVVSMNINEGKWATLSNHEPVNLNGSNSVFFAENNAENRARFAQMDIHGTAPMWGRGAEHYMRQGSEQHELELLWLSGYKDIMSALEDAGLDYQRRATRLAVADLEYTISDSDLTLKFELLPGQFATSLLRELITVGGKTG